MEVLRGAGGAGGYREFTKKYYTGTSYTVTVGAGGSANANGSDSSIERIGTGGGAGGSLTSILAVMEDLEVAVEEHSLVLKVLPQALDVTELLKVIMLI